MAAKGAIAVAAGALLFWLGLTQVAISYDDLYSLAWGQALVEHGDLDLFHPLAPLAHPLPVAIGAALGPLEPETAYEALSIICALSFGLLVYATLRLAAVLVGRERGLTAWAAGVAAVLLLLTSERLDFFALAGTVEVPAAGLVVLAVSLAVESPRTRPLLPLALLAVAGLLRPEPWLLGLAYCAWLAAAGLRGRGLALCGALAAAAPALWLLFALAATGEPLSPLTGNPEEVSLADLGFTGSSRSVLPEGVDDSFTAVADGVRSVLGNELALAALLAALASLLLHLRRRDEDPGAARMLGASVAALLLLAASVATTAAGAVFTDRYALIASVLLASVVVALLWRLPLAAAAGASAALVVLALAQPLEDPRAPTLVDVREKVEFSVDQRAEQEDLYSLTAKLAVRDAVAGCPDVAVGGEGTPQEVLFAKPLVAHGLGLSPRRVRAERVPPLSIEASSFLRDVPGGDGRIREGPWELRSLCLAAGKK